MRVPKPPRKILFATDFSGYSERARGWALMIASLTGASVVVAHVVEFVDTSTDERLQTWFEKLKREASERLAVEVELFRREGVGAVGDLAVGSPWEVVSRKCEEFEADLVVVGSHGLRTPEGRLLLGTTSHKVALTARPPVLIIKAEVEPSP